MAVFPDLSKWSPTLRRALWRCRNVGFPRPECRVTAPISAVWWPEEEATEILAWRKKPRDDDGGKGKKGIFFLIFALTWNLRWNAETGLLTRLSGWTPPVSAPLCRCISPLGGSKKLGSGSAAPWWLNSINPSAWAERRETTFSCFQSMWHKTTDTFH